MENVPLQLLASPTPFPPFIKEAHVKSIISAGKNTWLIPLILQLGDFVLRGSFFVHYYPNCRNLYLSLLDKAGIQLPSFHEEDGQIKWGENAFQQQPELYTIRSYNKHVFTPELPLHHQSLASVHPSSPPLMPVLPYF